MPTCQKHGALRKSTVSILLLSAGKARGTKLTKLTPLYRRTDVSDSFCCRNKSERRKIGGSSAENFLSPSHVVSVTLCLASSPALFCLSPHRVHSDPTCYFPASLPNPGLLCLNLEPQGFFLDTTSAKWQVCRCKPQNSTSAPASRGRRSRGRSFRRRANPIPPPRPWKPSRTCNPIWNVARVDSWTPGS